MARRRHWLRWVLKCVGAAVTFHLVLAWLGSGFFDWAGLYRGTSRWSLGSGRVQYDARRCWAHEPHAWHLDWKTQRITSWVMRLAPEWQIDKLGHHVRIPVWMALLLVAVPTVYLWHRDRRWPRGHCAECGYNLTGNVSGVCPECGENV